MPAEHTFQEPLLERLSASPEPLRQGSLLKKRKRAPEQEAKTVEKKSKTKKAKAIDDNELDLSAGINKSFSHMDSQLLADYVAQRTRKHESDLSSIELEDKYLPANAIQDTTAYDKPRILDNLPGFLEKFSGSTSKLWSASKKNGAPHTIIVTGAGLRAAEIARVMRKFQTKDATVAKLFAKHIKLQDSIKFLETSRTGIAVGTPTRLQDLLKDGALQVDRLERIVVDASHIDQKKRGILDMRETQIPLILWLGHQNFRDRYAAETSQIKLLFF